MPIENLDRDVLQNLISLMLDGGADFCDIYAEKSKLNGVTSDDKKLNTTSSSQTGVGLRAVKNDSTFYTVCQAFSERNLTESARNLVSAMKLNSAHTGRTVNLSDSNPMFSPALVEHDPMLVGIERKVDLVRSSQDTAWSYSDKVKQVTIRYSDSQREILLASSHTNEIQSQKLGLVELMILVYVGDNSDRQMGWAGKSFYRGMEAFSGENSPEQLAKAACKQAHTMLGARECPRGEIPVVFAPGENGVLFHESCGHGMEADMVEKGSSFAKLMGEMVASEKVTIHDNGTLPGYPGSYAFDDEGIPAQDTVLIENGRLVGYIQSLLTAKRFGVEPTGSGRRQSYKFPPIPRMRNTYIAAGNDDPEEIIRSTKRGIYASDVGFGGQVDVVTGRFITSILLGYLIEDGKITSPIKGATITGTGIEALKNVDRVGNDLVLNHSPGRCGKGQEVPAGVGMPTVRVQGLMVGGTGNSF